MSLWRSIRGNVGLLLLCAASACSEPMPKEQTPPAPPGLLTAGSRERGLVLLLSEQTARRAFSAFCTAPSNLPCDQFDNYRITVSVTDSRTMLTFTHEDNGSNSTDIAFESGFDCEIQSSGFYCFAGQSQEFAPRRPN